MNVKFLTKEKRLLRQKTAVKQIKQYYKLQSELREALSYYETVSQPMISMWFTNQRLIPPLTLLQLQILSDGAIQLKTMYPEFEQICNP